MRITILSIGKTKSAPLASLEEEYSRRLRRFRVERTYVKNASEMIRVATTHAGEVVLLDEHGPTMTSREFASFLSRAETTTNHLLLIIGTDDGFPDELRNMNADLFALSELTFPHEIVRVLLLEQLYRSQTIIEGHPYHK